MDARVPAAVIQCTRGVPLTAWRYLWASTASLSRETSWTCPRPLPAGLIDERSQLLEHGSDALYHHTFTITIIGASRAAEELIYALADNLHRGVPTDVTSVQPTRTDPGGCGWMRSRRADARPLQRPGPGGGPRRHIVPLRVHAPCPAERLSRVAHSKDQKVGGSTRGGVTRVVHPQPASV
jgi:hypothetical protein